MRIFLFDRHLETEGLTCILYFLFWSDNSKETEQHFFFFSFPFAACFQQHDLTEQVGDIFNFLLLMGGGGGVDGCLFFLTQFFEMRQFGYISLTFKEEFSYWNHFGKWVCYQAHVLPSTLYYPGISAVSLWWLQWEYGFGRNKVFLSSLNNENEVSDWLFFLLVIQDESNLDTSFFNVFNRFRSTCIQSPTLNIF